MDVAALVERAVQATRRLDRDPELEGVAHESTLRAIANYDATRNDSLEAWVVYVVKIDAIGYLRWRNSRREVPLPVRQRNEEVLIAAPIEPSHELLVSRADWTLLCEKYVERWNFRAIARKYTNGSVGRAKELVNAAVCRFVRAHEGAEDDESEVGVS